MKYILLLLQFFINAQIINVQGSVNSNDGPLGFATISIVDSGYGVTSNENGPVSTAGSPPAVIVPGVVVALVV